VFDFIQGVLTTDIAHGRRPGFNRREVQRLAMKFQQYTGPVAAKGVEDTAYYRHHRLVSLNEVGGDPERFGLSVGAFHKLNQAQARGWPRAMLATATHDTKRGEDCRSRISVLSEVADAWGARVRRWATLNARHKTIVDGAKAPSAADEYLFYQTLIGAWPLTLAADGEVPARTMAELRDRVGAYMRKAVREAKLHSDWFAPHAAYEDALIGFIAKALAIGQPNPFLADFRAFQAPLAAAGAVNGLAQTVLKLTLPGVPDVYQGCELWDLSLVDPDNRRPVDFRRRRRMLRALVRTFDPGRNAVDLDRLVGRWRQGWPKLFIIWRLLALRARHPALFALGKYVALPARGAHADQMCAFARRNRGHVLVVAVPRFVTRLPADDNGFPVGDAAWRDTRLPLPKTLALGTGRCVFSGQPVVPAGRPSGGGLHLPAAALFARLPVAAAVFPQLAEGSPRLRN
jgi:(1->4)-alpha-D-glucan 1-alpha-D-glucosylmutase